MEGLHLSEFYGNHKIVSSEVPSLPEGGVSTETLHPGAGTVCFCSLAVKERGVLGGASKMFVFFGFEGIRCPRCLTFCQIMSGAHVFFFFFPGKII